MLYSDIITTLQFYMIPISLFLSLLALVQKGVTDVVYKSSPFGRVRLGHHTRVFYFLIIVAFSLMAGLGNSLIRNFYPGRPLEPNVLYIWIPFNFILIIILFILFWWIVNFRTFVFKSTVK